MNHFKYKDFSSGANTTWEPLSSTSTNPSTDDIQEEHAQLKKMVDDLTQAVLDPGTNKAHHMKVLVRHRTEWPYLWEKIDSIVSFIADSDTKNK